MQDISIKIDRAVNCSYIRLTNNRTEFTRVLDGGINLDIDSNGAIVGIEQLHLDDEIPFEYLKDEFQMSDGDIAKVKKLLRSA